MTSAYRILEIVGKEAMDKLCAEFGGQMVYIPSTTPEIERDERIAQEFDKALRSGSTCMNAYEKCAQGYGLSPRQVQRIIASGYRI